MEKGGVPRVDAAGPAPAPRGGELVRNVVVVGHAAAGKTTLVEALLARSGAIGAPGSVADGTTASDSEDVERTLGHSVALSLTPLVSAGVKVNLLDTPGTADFVGEVRAGLRTADGALFVVSAVHGVDPLTVQLWEECDLVGLPRVLVITQLDRPRADFDDVVAICQRVLGEGVLPLYLPMHGDAHDERVAGVIGLLSQRVYDWSTGDRVERDPDPQHLPLIETLRGELLEAVIAESEDETLLERYLDGEDLDPKVVVADLERAVARAQLFPVVPAAPLTMLGTDELLELLTQAMPTPLAHPCPVVTRPDGTPAAPLSCAPEGPLVAEVVRTTTDPHLGRVSLVRVFSGTLVPDSVLHLSRTGEPTGTDVQVGALLTPLGAALRHVAECRAGDLVAVVGLQAAQTGDTLSAPDDPLLLQPWELPQPQHVVALELADPGVASLQRLVAEDPTLRLERRPETGQLLLWSMGAAQVEVLLHRLSGRDGVTATQVPVEVPLRATLAGFASVTAATGGQLAFEPLPAGSGVELSAALTGTGLEKGLRAELKRGVDGRPLVDVRVALSGGPAVASSDQAQREAGAHAVREARAQVGVQLLEPVSRIDVRLPAAYVGSAVSDLSGRRAGIVGNEVTDDVALIIAEVPDLELLGYAAALRRVSHGTGSFRRTHVRHQALPAEADPSGASSPLRGPLRSGS